MNLFLFYEKLGTKKLKQMCSLKYLELSKIDGKEGYFKQHDINALKRQIDAIDRVLEARKQRGRLF